MAWTIDVFTGLPHFKEDVTTLGDDHLSGYDEILSSETIIVTARKQMVVTECYISGVLQIEGTLVLI